MSSIFRRPLDPLADGVLPLLLLAGIGLAAGLVGGSAARATGWPILPGLGLAALAFALEAFLFTTLFFVRDVDPPYMLRWVEVVLVLAAAEFLAATPLHGEYISLSLLLLMAAWGLGLRIAFLLGKLNPALLELTEGQERLMTADHSQAFDSLRKLLLGELGLVALSITGVGRFTGAWFGLMFLVVLALAALLVAAQLRQMITWRLERLDPAPQVAARWAAQGVTLLVLPLLLGLLLPAGPSLPLGWLYRRDVPMPAAPLPLQPRADQPATDSFPQVIQDWIASTEAWRYAWLLTLAAKVLLAVAAAAVVCLIVRTALAQLRERLGPQELKGIWAVAALLAAWYGALFRAARGWLGGAVRRAVAVPAETAAALLGEAGVLGRFSPFRGRAPSDPRAAVRYFYARLQREAARRGVPRADTATPAEFAAQLAVAAPDREADVQALTQAYEQARYSPEVVAPDQAALVRRTWVAIARAVRRRHQ